MEDQALLSRLYLAYNGKMFAWSAIANYFYKEMREENIDLHGG
jgi:hypothetical protein